MMHLAHLRFHLILAPIIGIYGCSSLPDMHQDIRDEGMQSWEQSIETDSLRANLLWTKPMVSGPHPTIIVHPGMRQTATDMRGLLKDLSKQGYLAVAIDYQRRVADDWSYSTMPLRDKSEVDFVISHITQNPLVDRTNIALLGFSLGGAHSLRLAENNPSIKAVVVYYPMTDFIDWTDSFAKNFLWWFVVEQIKNSYLAEANHHTEATHRELLSRYSAINFVNKVNAPVLIIHGDKDRVTPLYHSENFVSSLQKNGNTKSKLVVLEDTSHAFNFKRSEKSMRSWYTSLAWISRHLESSSQQISLLNSDGNES